MPWRPTGREAKDWGGAGRTFQAIADALMADGIPTSRGRTRWYPATIRAIVTSDNAAALV